MMKRCLRWLLAVVVVAGSADSGAQAAQARGGGGTAASVAALEREARQIETMLIAPCCWSEQVSRHHSEAAEGVKTEIRAMLAAGLTRQQVLDRFVAAYGARILAEPPDAGFSRVLHHAPWLVGAASVLGLALFVRHVTRRRSAVSSEEAASPAGPGQPPAGEPNAKAASDDERRLDDELRDLD